MSMSGYAHEYWLTIRWTDGVLGYQGQCNWKCGAK